ncbi:MAG: hypothetical protein IKB88_02845 [Clostridia bacterium]|nr:hypothetical protein [Clostridia bacterium]
MPQFSKIKNSFFSRFSALKNIPEKARIAIIVSAAAVIVLLAVVITVLIITGNNVEKNSVLVYQKGDSTVIRINDKELILNESGADGFKTENKEKRVYYTVPSEYDDELFDLYYVGIEKGEITEPIIIDFAVEKDFDIANGKVYYRKYSSESRSDEGCICDIESNKITEFSTNVDEIFVMGEEGVYFTKMHGDNKVLYSFFEDTPKEISRNIIEIRSFGKADKPHLFYESKPVPSKNSTELYIVYGSSAPELICDNAAQIMYDEYVEGGNLYYFTSSQESVSWSYVISDNFAESDKTMTKPNRLDYFDLFGVTEAYNKAYVAYQDKLIRDEIRQELDAVVAKGDFAVPVYTAFAYNGESVARIAQDVDPARVYAVAPKGTPKIVYEMTAVKAEKTDMATLSGIAARSGMDEVITYAVNIVSESVESKGMAIALGKSGGSVNYELKDYDKSRTQFRFSENGNILFGIVKDTVGNRSTLYVTDVTENVSDKKTVSSGISSFDTQKDSVVYLKTDDGKSTGDIFSFDGKETSKISNAAVDFSVDSNDCIYVFKDYNGFYNEPLADYYAYDDGEEVVAGENVIISTLKGRADGSSAFIENRDGETVLRIYSKGKTTDICQGATNIILFN